jgi:hypothetical protein
MQQALGNLWGSIRCLQMAVYPSLSNISYPAKNLLVLSLLITFSNADPMSSISENYILAYIPVKETDPFNQ